MHQHTWKWVPSYDQPAGGEYLCACGLIGREVSGDITALAHAAGIRDGAAWDLSGYESVEAAAALDGWDDCTINALGPTECMKAWGLGVGVDWQVAGEEYNTGVRAALLARASR